MRFKKVIRKTLISIFIVCLIVFITGWILTWPRERFHAYPTMNGNGKIIIVKTWAPNIPFVIRNSSKFYSEINRLIIRTVIYFLDFHRDRPIEIRIFDVNKNSLERKNWAIDPDEVLGVDKPILDYKSGRLITTISKPDNGKTRSDLRFYNMQGKLKREYKHKEMITEVVLSPDGSLLYVEDYAKNHWLYDIQKKEIQKLEGFSNKMTMWPEWPQNEKLFFALIRKQNDTYRRGIHSYNTINHQVKLEFSGSGYDISPDGKKIAVCEYERKKPKKFLMTLYSLYNKEKISEILLNESCFYPVLHPSSNKFMIIDKDNQEKSFLKVYDWSGSVIQKIDFQKEKPAPIGQEWVTSKYILTGLMKTTQVLKIFRYSKFDAALINTETGEVRRVSDIVRKQEKN